MNREIKFRAWDNIKGKMIANSKDAAYDDAYWDGLYMSEYDMLARLLSSKKWTYMQYTGLKDVNGKEIYEGDILEVVNLEEESYYWTGYENGMKGKLIISSNFCLCLLDEDGEHIEHWNDGNHSTGFSGFSDYASEHIKVLGNIYENKELLNND